MFEINAPNQHAPLVYLVDDDEAVREAVALLLSTIGMEVQSFNSAQRFLENFDAQAIGCLVVDIRMPGMSGLQLQERLQELRADIPVVVITGHGDVNLARRAFLGGAIEFLTKPIDEQTLIDTLQKAVRAQILSRERLSSTRLAREHLARLSSRELEVLRLMVDGLTSKQIARQLALSPRTVETHRAHLMEKLEVDSLAGLVRLYLTGLNEHP
jgi:two-component system, LuxR family, response regulator FixJ